LEIEEEKRTIENALFDINCTNVATNCTLPPLDAFGNASLTNVVGYVSIKAKSVYDLESGSSIDSFYATVNVMGFFHVFESIASGTATFYGCDTDRLSQTQPPYITRVSLYLFEPYAETKETMIKIVSKETGEITYSRRFGEKMTYETLFLPLRVDLIDVYNANFGSYRNAVSDVLELCASYDVLRMIVVAKTAVTTEFKGSRSIKFYDIASHSDDVRKMDACELSTINDTLYDCYDVKPYEIPILGCEALLREYAVPVTLTPEPQPVPESRPMPVPEPEMQPFPESQPTNVSTPENRPVDETNPDETNNGSSVGNSTTKKSFPYENDFLNYRNAIYLLITIAWVFAIFLVCFLMRRLGLCCQCLKRDRQLMTVVPLGDFVLVGQKEREGWNSSGDDTRYRQQQQQQQQQQQHQQQNRYQKEDHELGSIFSEDPVQVIIEVEKVNLD
jgi:hypothetical protein